MADGLGFDGDDLPAGFSRRELQLFLWYQLPKKGLIRTAEQQAAQLAALCRSPDTDALIRSRGKYLAAALERSGLEPPDTPLLTWSEFMSIEEALGHDLVASLLEDTIDTGELVPGAKGWRQHQTELVEGYLSRPDESGTAPLARIHAFPPRGLARAARPRHPARPARTCTRNHRQRPALTG